MGLISTFYRRVDPQSCVNVGLEITCSTIMWWLQQSDAARATLTSAGDPAVSITDALKAFTHWINEHGLADALYWGNGATADNVWMSSAYAAVGFPRPWGYRQDRCYRTLKSLFPDVEEQEQLSTAHHALDDAMHEGGHLVALLRRATQEDIGSGLL